MRVPVVRVVRPAVPVRTVRPQVGRLEKARHQGLGRVQRHGANFLVLLLVRMRGGPTGMVEEGGRIGGHRTGAPDRRMQLSEGKNLHGCCLLSFNDDNIKR